MHTTFADAAYELPMRMHVGVPMRMHVGVANAMFSYLLCGPLEAAGASTTWSCIRQCAEVGLLSQPGGGAACSGAAGCVGHREGCCRGALGRHAPQACKHALF